MLPSIPPNVDHPLSEKQSEILELLATGYNPDQIAVVTDTSIDTTRAWIASLLDAFRAPSVPELIEIARRQRLGGKALPAKARPSPAARPRRLLSLAKAYHCSTCSAILVIEEDAFCNCRNILWKENHWSDGYMPSLPAKEEAVYCEHCNSIIWLASCVRSRNTAIESEWRELTVEEQWEQFEIWKSVHYAEMRKRVLDAYRAQIDDPAWSSAEEAAFAKQNYFARQYIRWDNHRDRSNAGENLNVGGARSSSEMHRRKVVLRALAENCLKLTRDTERARLCCAEWYREAGEWGTALGRLAAPFQDGTLAQIANVLRVLIGCQIDKVVILDTGLVLTSSRKLALPALEKRRRREERLPEAPPRKLLEAILDPTNTTPKSELLERYVPDRLNKIAKWYAQEFMWEVDEIPLAICRAIAFLCSLREGVEDSRFLWRRQWHDQVVSFWCSALRGSSWDQWTYSGAQGKYTARASLMDLPGGV